MSTAQSLIWNINFKNCCINHKILDDLDNPSFVHWLLGGTLHMYFATWGMAQGSIVTVTQPLVKYSASGKILLGIKKHIKETKVKFKNKDYQQDLYTG